MLINSASHYLTTLGLTALCLLATPSYAVTTSATSGSIDEVATYTTCAPSSSKFPWATDDCVTGYTSAPSVNKGGKITFKISVNPAPQTFSINFFRMGWYGGVGSKLVSTVADHAGVKQPDCPMDKQTGLTECNWSDSYTLNVPTTWTTGVYSANVTNQSGWKTSIVFVVRDDQRAADFLYQLPILTYAAYNDYPTGSVTGKSLYDNHSSGANTLVGSIRAVKVSLDRPTKSQFGGWLGSDQTEIQLVAWLEKMGYNVNYTTDIDAHSASPGYLESYKGIIIGGHSEYWTKAMYDKAEFARGAGTNLAFFGADAVKWQVRLENSTSGVPNRIITCYKDDLTTAFDPITDPSLKTRKWRNLGRPEQTLIGVQVDTNGFNGDTSNQPSFLVKNSSHWVYKGSNFTNSSAVPYLIGPNVDNLDDAYPGPPLLTPTSQTIIGESPFINDSGVNYISQASIYQAPSGAWVFGAGTGSWSWALARQADTSDTPNVFFENAGIQQTTQNILDTFKKAAIESLETKVITTYRNAGLSGASQGFGFGKYRADRKELALVGDNAISSFKIKPGYTVLMCTNIPPSKGVCKNYTAKTTPLIINAASLTLDKLNDQISYIQVKPAINLALGKKTSQSSTYRGIAVAERAVDGDTNGNYADQSIALTNKDLNAWWQVDLAGQYNIHDILLGNRLDCCSTQLANFYVFVSTTDLTDRSFNDIVNDTSVWRYRMRGQVGASLSIPATIKGRYVRVQLANQNYLALREVLIR
jgi:hypothetical protein